MTNAETATRQQVIVRKKNSGVAFLLMDGAGKVNLLGSSVLSEFEAAVDQIASDDSIKAVVLISGKADSFVLGADLHEIIKFDHQLQALKLSEQGQAVFNKLAHLGGKPTVAAINGSCLGGGLEMALCCDRLIGTNAPITVIGLPEVKLGFVPGLGGTQRLPRRIGIKAALEVILSAEPVSAQRALDLNILDEIVSPDDLMHRAEELALELTKLPLHQRSVVAPPMEAGKEQKFFAMVERSVRIKTKGRYPAQTAVLEVIKTGLSQGLEAGLKAEAKTFAELSVGEVSRNLVFLFFTTELARQMTAAMALRAPEKGLVVGIIGGGLMGQALSKLAAASGYKVLLRAANKERQAQAMAKATASFQHDDNNQTGGQIISVEDDSQLQEANLILEAAAENEKTKLELLAQISKVMKPDAVLATNTSSLSVTKLASAVENPERFLGLHFFNPADKMPLVELVANPQTNKLAIAAATAFVHQLSKIPVTTKDSPGYLVNRVLNSYICDAARLAEEVPISWIEEAAVDFGMPMGPMALIDEVGLDICNMVSQAQYEAFGDRCLPPKTLSPAMKLGMIGRKNGRGVYLWQNDKKTELNPQVLEIGLMTSCDKLDMTRAKEFAQSMILPMVDEAARCLDEKVVRRAREVDLCLVMGLGFPPFRGGLLRYADSVGIATVIEKLEMIYSRGGPKRTVSDYLKRLREQNRGFYARGTDES